MANVIQLLCTAPCWVADKKSIYISAEGHEHQTSIPRTERSLSAGRRELERSYPGRGALSLLSPLIDCGWCVVSLMGYLGWALLNHGAAEKKAVSSRYSSKSQSSKRGEKQKVAERCFDVKARASHNQERFQRLFPVIVRRLHYACRLFSVAIARPVAGVLWGHEDSRFGALIRLDPSLGCSGVVRPTEAHAQAHVHPPPPPCSPRTSARTHRRRSFYGKTEEEEASTVCRWVSVPLPDVLLPV